MKRSSNVPNDFDKMSRLTAEDQEMCGRVNLYKTEKVEKIAVASPSASLSSTPPQDTSFLTEETMKKIVMPKKIEF
ncbi:hypothetical protein IV203_029174 [Nitzschia inconspicua]|uniref:Uncharacterized protein n=1 Tax=Nitzschia inconspicua TaxID=303405 RepID=A0A9K3LRB3_9STRA|nr:hypothetical protein IV203_008473 [Nitzschia inconspicua]KAG7366504.1 hypothetical protein IV203_029174 [Nitzschia inconspicua]